MKRKYLVELVIHVPVLLLATVAAMMCEQSGLSVWQTCLVTLPLGTAIYWGIGSPILDRYMEWNIRREMAMPEPDDE